VRWGVEGEYKLLCMFSKGYWGLVFAGVHGVICVHVYLARPERRFGQAQVRAAARWQFFPHSTRRVRLECLHASKPNLQKQPNREARWHSD